MADKKRGRKPKNLTIHAEPGSFKLTGGEVGIEIHTAITKPILTEQPRVISSTDIQQEVRPYFKASRHVEEQKFKIATKSRQLLLGEDADILNISSYGLDLTENQDRALHAVQKLLADTQFNGDGKIDFNSADFKISGAYLPYLSINYSDYYQAYGLEPAGDGRYRGAQAEQAMKALESLTEMRWLRYKRKTGKYDKDGRPLFDLISVKKPLIHLQLISGYQNLTEEDIQKILSGQELPEEKEHSRATKILLLPSPILTDEIDKYYILKPVGLHNEIKALSPGRRISRSNSLFIELLLFVDLPVWRINKEELARQLNQDSLIESRQKSRLNKIIQEALEKAKTLGFLLDYEEEPTGLLILKLNPDRCGGVRNKLSRKKRGRPKKEKTE